MKIDLKLQRKYEIILPHLTEKQKRIFLSAESEYFVRAGITKVSLASRVSRGTISKSLQELKDKGKLSLAVSRKKELYLKRMCKMAKQNAKVIVFSSPYCSWCKRVKDYLRQNRIRFAEVDVTKDAAASKDIVRRTGQQ